MRLVPPVARGRLAVGALVFAVLLFASWAAGVLGSTQEPDVSPSAAVFFSAILAYIVPIYHYILTRTAVAFDELSPWLDADADQVAAWRRSIGEKSVRWTVATVGAGVAAGFVHNTLLFESPAAFAEAVTTSAAQFAIATGTILVWVAMTTVITSLIENAFLFARLAARTRFDLLDTSTLTPFGRVAVISTLALTGAQASYPILWLSPEVGAIAFIPGVLATAVPMLLVFILPIWRIHRRIAGAKNAELERVRTAIEARERADVVDPAGLSQLSRLNALLMYRRELSRIHEWPFDVSVVMRLAFYLVIPPLTWVGAALIENLVEAFV